MDQFILDSLITTRWKDMEYLNILMETNMKGLSVMASSMEKEYLNGVMVKSMREGTYKEIRKDME